MKICLTIIAVSLILACAGPAVIEEPTTPARPKIITFFKDYKGTLSKNEPQFWYDYYRLGDYFFDQGDYTRALEMFLKAADRARGEALRTCLTSACLSALGAGDKRFYSLRRRLADDTPSDPLESSSITDTAIHALGEIAAPKGGQP